MWVWFIFLLFLAIGGIFTYFLWKRATILQQRLNTQSQIVLEKDNALKKKDTVIVKKNVELETTNKKLQQQLEKIDTIKQEKATIEAKYYKKLKSAEVKKKNLAKYHQKKRIFVLLSNKWRILLEKVQNGFPIHVKNHLQIRSES